MVVTATIHLWASAEGLKHIEPGHCVKPFGEQKRYALESFERRGDERSGNERRNRCRTHEDKLEGSVDLDVSLAVSKGKLTLLIWVALISAVGTYKSKYRFSVL